MTRLFLLLFLLATPATAQSLPDAAAVDPRLQVVAYDAGQVVRLKVAVNYQATVMFAPGETVENVAVGNSDAWQVTANQRGDAIFVKPIQPGSVSNMTVITNARVYTFELASAYSPEPDTALTLRFSYPAAQPRPDAPVAQPGIGRYRVGGARALRPTAMTDDGLSTMIEWPGDRAIPAVFAIDEQGDEILLQGHMRDGRYVIDAVHQTLVFRMDGRTARAVRSRVRD